GTYTVYAEDENGCITGEISVEVVVNENPQVNFLEDSYIIYIGENVEIEPDVTGGLQPYSYTWYYEGSELTGEEGSSLVIDNAMLDDEGQYSLLVEDANGCYSLEAFVDIIVFETLYVEFTQTEYVSCENGTVEIESNVYGGAEPFIYRWYHDGTELPEESGSSLIIEDIALADGGTYTLEVEDNNGYIAEISAPVTVNENPDVFDVQPAGVYDECDDLEISLDQSQPGVNYYLYIDDEIATHNYVEGTGDEISFGVWNILGEYSVIAVDSETGCQSIMNGTVVVDFVVDVDIFNVISIPDSDPARFCEGSDGVEIGLDGSTSGRNYDIFYDGDVYRQGEANMGKGDPFYFDYFVDDVGFYRVVANAGNECYIQMNGVIEVRMDPLPNAITVTADDDGYFCQKSDGVSIWIDDYEEGVEYNLIDPNGDEVDMIVGTGNSDPLMFESGPFNIEGEYSVIGIYHDSGCDSEVGSVILTEEALPDNYNLEAFPDNSFCADGGSVDIYLNGSQDNVEYELYKDGSPLSPQMIVSNGGGGRVIFEGISDEGDYTVIATDMDSGCQNVMNEGEPLSIIEKPMPDIVEFNVTYDDSLGDDCFDEQAVISSDEAQDNVVYELYKYIDGNYIATGYIADENGQFEPFVDSDAKYNVLAELDDCYKWMIDDSDLDNLLEVHIDGAFGKYLVVGNENLCLGDEGSPIGLSNSDEGITYNLYIEGRADYLESLEGTGDYLEFGMHNSEGIYYVVGEDENDCEIEMLNRFELIFNPLPESYRISGPSSYCGDNGFEISVEKSEDGVDYYLMYREDAEDYRTEMDKIIGAGESITFFDNNSPGIYSVYASNEYGCTSSMENVVVVQEQDAPLPVTVEEVIEYCQGDAAVVEIADLEGDVNYEIYNDSDELIYSFNTEFDSYEIFGVEMPDGDYKIIGSFDGACEVEVASFTINSLPLPHDNLTLESEWNFDADGNNVTQNSFDVFSLFTHSDVEYELHGVESLDVTNNIQQGGDLISWEISADPGYYELYVTARFIDDDNSCESISNTLSFTIAERVDDFEVLFEDGKEYCSNQDGVYGKIENSFEGVRYDIIREDGVIIESFIGDGEDYKFRYTLTGATDNTRIPNETNKTSYRVEAYSADKHPFVFEFEITEHPSPNQYLLSPSNGAVDNDAIRLNGSDDGVWYFLLRNGNIDYNSEAIIGDGERADFGPVSQIGSYDVLAVSDKGCETFMQGTASMYEQQLVAKPIYIYMGVDDISRTIELSDSIESLPALDGPNLRYFHIEDYGAPVVDHDLRPGDIIINEETGTFTFTKRPSFYGQDTVRYRVENSFYPDRWSESYIIVMAGNREMTGDHSFVIPNAFAPNGDGRNDRFVIRGLGDTEETSLEVFNRWGTIVYRSSGNSYNNDWDGTANVSAMVSVGKELPTGVYFYVFEVVKNIPGEGTIRRKFHGSIELRR
ncbi:gliding motility-associated C-terminal domain-containing protein, partial [Marinilabiliaceae bacterium ANBcel2]|nr:gliding motility-associated C-terminal domain-containing protein [Marinilabiliaceae bacterium ANBcel2]